MGDHLGEFLDVWRLQVDELVGEVGLFQIPQIDAEVI